MINLPKFYTANILCYMVSFKHYYTNEGLEPLSQGMYNVHQYSKKYIQAIFLLINILSNDSILKNYVWRELSTKTN